jgi:hypothetical protein
MAERMAVESPESGQPDRQEGSCSAVELMSWPSARKVLVPDGAAVPLGETDGAAVADTGALGEGAEVGDPAKVGDPTATGDPADVLAALAAGELADELHADTSKAKPASAAPAATCRAVRD